MTFFNKKEDVIKIELTSHGKNLLSHGKLKPAYYAFYDDNILYNTDKAGFSETNAESKGRILSGTVYQKPQTNYRGVESRNSDMRGWETENHLLYPIGTNRVEEDNLNGWNVTFLHNTASTVSKTYGSSTISTLNIPQVECTVEYKLVVESIADAYIKNKISTLTPDVAFGENFVHIKDQQLLVEISEKNGFKHKDSLEVEVYLFEQDESTFKRLKFEKERDRIQNDILVEKSTLDDLFGEPPDNNADYVGYFFDLAFDKMISSNDLCSGLGNLKANDVYLDLEVECPDEFVLPLNVYGITVAEEEDCEDD